MRTRLALCALAAAALIAGCGGSKSTSHRNASSTTAKTTPATTQPAAQPLPNMYAMPSPPPPHPGARVNELIIKDIRQGTGQEIHAGDTAIVEFVLSDYKTGRVISRSWGKKHPYEVKIEHNVVIDGWWQGVPGMRVGGRRVLIIPPALGFTTSPNPEVAGRTTYFDIVLMGIVPASPGEKPASG